MAKIIFSNETIEILSKSDAISKITTKSITYSKEFKVAVATCKNILEVQNVFKEWKIDIELIGDLRVEQCWYRWRRQLNAGGDKIFAKEQRGRKGKTDEVPDSSDKDAYIKYLETQNELQRQELVVLKKYIPTWDQTGTSRDVICEAIYLALENNEIINIENICITNGFYARSYYKYIKKRSNKLAKKKHDSKLVVKIKELKSKKFCKNHGYRQVTMALNSGTTKPTNHKRVLRIMREYDLLSKARKSKPYSGIMKENIESKIAPNILNSEFNHDIPDSIFLTDITYLQTKTGKTYYLSVAKDMATREIAAWNIREDMKIDLSTDIINELASNGKTKALVHSDQGVHYTSKQFSDLLDSNNMIQSMSRRGKCTDNGPMESFFGHLKDEVEYSESLSLSEITETIKEYMLYYNQQRGQWNLKKMPPIAYRQHLLSN